LKGLWDALNKEIGQRVLEKLNQTLSKSLNLVDVETPLSGIELTVPQLAECHLLVEYMDSDELAIDMANDQYAFIKTLHPNLNEAILNEKDIITDSDSVKTCYKLRFSSSSKFEYEPGHAIEIISPNDDDEISRLFEHLNITLTDRFRPIQLRINNSSKKSGSNLVQLTKQAPTCLQYLFKYCLDIRSNSLKKGLLRVLAQACTNDNDKRRLLELSSKEGTCFV
jgi:sulfite reductase alpha subunit-like flavoprotein